MDGWMDVWMVGRREGYLVLLISSCESTTILFTGRQWLIFCILPCFFCAKSCLKIWRKGKIKGREKERRSEREQESKRVKSKNERMKKSFRLDNIWVKKQMYVCLYLCLCTCIYIYENVWARTHISMWVYVRYVQMLETFSFSSSLSRTVRLDIVYIRSQLLSPPSKNNQELLSKHEIL